MITREIEGESKENREREGRKKYIEKEKKRERERKINICSKNEHAAKRK